MRQCQSLFSFAQWRGQRMEGKREEEGGEQWKSLRESLGKYDCFHRDLGRLIPKMKENKS